MAGELDQQAIEVSFKATKISYNLFNSFPADVIDTFYLLDEDNFELALNAIKIRFNKM